MASVVTRDYGTNQEKKPDISGLPQETHTAAQPHQQEDPHGVARRTPLEDELSLADLAPPRVSPNIAGKGCHRAGTTGRPVTPSGARYGQLIDRRRADKWSACRAGRAQPTFAAAG